MQNHQVTFNLIDRNQPLYRYSSHYQYDVFNEMLLKVDTILNFMMDSGMTQVNLNTLNFDNLVCIVTRDSVSPSYSKQFPINEYKFDINEAAFIGKSNNDKIYINSKQSSELEYIWNQISQKLECFSTDISQQINKQKTLTPPAPIKQIKQVNPIHKLFEDTHKVINTMTNQDVKNVPTRAIPIIESSEEESDENDDTEDEEDKKEKEKEKEKPTNKLTVKTNTNNRLVGPDVPRPMESIVLNEDISPEELKKTIEALENLKELEQQRLKELEEINNKDTHNFSKFCNNLGDVKREFLRNKEREQERRNKFEANKGAYRKMKQHIVEGKITEDRISPLFKNDYPIYKFMDDKGILDTPDDYILYLNMYDELYPKKESTDKSNKSKEEYIPHNVHYLSDEEQQKYLAMKSSNKNMIEEFMHNQTETNVTNTTKKYPSVDEILEKVGDDTTDNFDEITFEPNKTNNIDTIATELIKNLQN